MRGIFFSAFSLALFLLHPLPLSSASKENHHLSTQLIPDWVEAAYRSLYTDGIFSADFRQEWTRIQVAGELKKELSRFLSSSQEISSLQKDKIDKLIDEFSDELYLVGLWTRLNLQQEQMRRMERREVTRFLQARILFVGQKWEAHPVFGSNAFFSQQAFIEFVDSQEKLAGFLGLRGGGQALDFAQQSRPGIDQSYVRYFLAQTENRPSFSLTAGSFYFILGPLGLIANNFFASFEGGRADIAYKKFSATTIYSRQSATNYPFTTFFVDDDDYIAYRLQAEIFPSVEVGVNHLLSGIATETAASLDIYFALGKRQFAGEFGFYRPSLTNFLESPTYRSGWVLGGDIYASDFFTAFLQIGEIKKGFTPIASSLAFSSASQQLFFDQNTKGLDLTFTFKPRASRQRGEKNLANWVAATRPDRLGRLPTETLVELEFVSLWNAEDGRPALSLYILRSSIPVVEKIFGRETGLKLFFENIFSDRNATIQHPFTQFNEARFILSYQF